MNKLITEELLLKDVNPKLAQTMSKELGIKEEEVQLIRKGLTPSDVKFEDGERAIISYITTNAVDRDNEIVDPKGAILKDYKKHPIVLFGHDYRELPIGRNEWIKTDEKGLIAKTIYAEHAKAEEIYQYRKAGFPLAESIGFIPLKVQELTEEESKEHGGAKRIYKKWILLEYSDVAVPSNQEAMQIAIAKGLLSHDHKEEDIITYAEEKLWEDMPNEIRFRIKNPNLFQDDSFKRIPIKQKKPKIFGIAGKLKDEDTMTLQSLRFPKGDDWTLSKAKDWVKDNPDISKEKLEDILLKILQGVEDKIEKEGRVLSNKNRVLIKECIEVLNKLYVASEPTPEPKSLDKKEEYNNKLNALMAEVSDVLKKI